ncbi:MAG: phosphatase PAP2 family protein [Bacteroidetes bacterium]|nr:phosphatase PAP2 family protein [Bacteroidota bacterium]
MQKESLSLVFLLANSMRRKFIFHQTPRKVFGWIGRLSLILIILCGSSVFAQNSTLPDSIQSHKYNFSQFGRETLRFLIQPTKWDGSDYLKIGLLGATTFLVMQTDEPIRKFINLDTKYAKSFPLEFGNMWGELYFTELMFGGFTLYALYANDKTAHKIAFEIAQATFYTFLVNGTLKYVIGRARPYLEQGNQTYSPFSRYDNPDHQSFPGGHTGITLALTTVLSRNAKPLWLKILAYVPAALSVAGRVYLDKHWTSDVFFGGAVGYFIATWVVDQHEKPVENGSEKAQVGIRGVNIQPYLSDDSYGLALILSL